MSSLTPAARAIIRQTENTRCNPGTITATVFGATGFLGRYICAKLGQTGNTLVAPYRGDENEIRHLKVSMDLGNFAPVPFNVRDRDSVREAIEGSDIVINLMGKHYQTKHALPWWINYTLDDVHVEGAKVIAEVAKECGVPRMIHHSSLIAKPNSPSIWAASKYRGEMAVKKAFPDVNIVRSGIAYGPEDRFLRWHADCMSSIGIPLIDNGAARLQPVSSRDISEALYAICVDDTIKGETFELVGDDEYTYKEIADFLFEVTKTSPSLINLPLPVAKLAGKAIQNLPNPFFTEDLAVLMSLDQVKTSNLPGLKELGVKPSNMEKQAFNFLYKYNRGGHFQEVSGYH